MKVALIGRGAIARYVQTAATERGHLIGAILVRTINVNQDPDIYIKEVSDLPKDIDIVIDCAGHQALSRFGPDILSRGINLVTVSIGALADKKLFRIMEDSAVRGNSKLLLASGAIGALDCLKAASTGKLRSVTYVGTKPPNAWKGVPHVAASSL